MTNDQCAAAPLPAHSSFAIRHSLSASIARLLTLAIRAYQLTLSPLQTFLFGASGGCRYTPSCSAYAVEALQEHGALTGTVLAARRICRCHPWGGCGHDPVPRRIPHLTFQQTDAQVPSSLVGERVKEKANFLLRTFPFRIQNKDTAGANPIRTPEFN